MICQKTHLLVAWQGLLIAVGKLSELSDMLKAMSKDANVQHVWTMDGKILADAGHPK